MVVYKVLSDLFLHRKVLFLFQMEQDVPSAVGKCHLVCLMWHLFVAMSSKVRSTESIDCIVERENVSATILSEPFMYWISEVLFTNPSARAGYDTESIFKRSLTGFEFRVFLLLD